MTKICCLSLWRNNGADQAPIKLAEALKLDFFSFFTRGTIQETLVFGARTCVQRTQLGSRQTVGLKDQPFLIHVYVRHDGLAGVVVTDEEYPQRVAFGLLSKTMQTFEEKVGDKWTRVQKDADVAPPFMVDDLEKFQDPRNDKICKIQQDLDDIKGVMRANIEDILQRGETLDNLMEKSNDLSASSKQFAKKAQKANSCCRSW